MRTSGRAVIALNAIVTVAAIGLACRTVNRADDSGRLVIRSHQILMAADEAMRPLLEAESWERAYLLTHTQDDLAAYNRAHDSVEAPVDSLAEILRQEGQGATTERLRAEIARSLAAFDVMVEQGRAGRPIDPAARTTARATIEAVRTSMRALRQNENNNLSERLRVDAKAGRLVNWIA